MLAATPDPPASAMTHTADEHRCLQHTLVWKMGACTATIARR